MQLEIVFFVFFGLWLFAASAILYWILRHYLRLVKLSGGNLKSVIDKLVELEEKNGTKIKILENGISDLNEDESLHIQKIGLVRFNPFSDTGGDQSFSLALLNRLNSGVLISGLHTRDRTRIYVKPVKKAKSAYVLSKEEKRAIEEAK